MRDELHELVDQLPEAELRPVLEVIRVRVQEDGGSGRNLPFFSSFEAEPDLAERSEEILSIVDAAVIAIAERLGLTEVATIDHRLGVLRVFSWLASRSAAGCRRGH